MEDARLRVRFGPVAAVFACLMGCFHSPTDSPESASPVGFAMFPSSGTQGKPQSKLWHHAGSYWCAIDGPDGNRIFRLRDRVWVPQPEADAWLSGHSARTDVLWNGSRLVVLVFDNRPQPPAVTEFEFEEETRSWRRLDGFPVELSIERPAETMVLDEDSRGRLWATYTARGRVHVLHSGPDHRRWNASQVLRDGLTIDDISSVIAFDGKVGVFWSDQTRDEFGFRMRSDGWPADAWSDVEIVAAGSGRADDHVNLAHDAMGRLYAVTKDAQSRLSVHLRDPGGTWITRDDLLEGRRGTRPIAMVSEADQRLVVLYTRLQRPADVIEARIAPLGTLEFGPAMVFMAKPGADLNDVTGMKQPLPAGDLIGIAHDGAGSWWNGAGTPLVVTSAPGPP